MEKMTKKEMATEILNGSEENVTYDELMKLKWDQLDTKLKAIKLINLKNGEKKMKKLEMKENFVIGSRDAKLQLGHKRKAVKAVVGQPAQKAIKEKKDKDGNIIQEAQSARAAIPEKKALPERQDVHLDCATEEIFHEVRARMADQGFMDKFDGQITENKDGRFRLTYVAETDKPIRAAFKKVKAKDGYNAPGLAALKEKEKAEKAAQKTEEKPKTETKKKTSKKKAETEPTPEPTDGDDGWPEEFDE